MIHEIINPSDKYTIECDDMALLTASIFLLGEGLYGTTSEETDYQVPLTVFGAKDGVSVFKDEFGFDLSEYIGTHKKEIAECLNSVCLGDFEERKLYFSALDKIEDPERKKAFINEWFEEKQSSTNEIGQRAYALANHLNKT